MVRQRLQRTMLLTNGQDKLGVGGVWRRGGEADAARVRGLTKKIKENVDW